MWWMKHEKHGEGPVYMSEEVEIRKAAGWTLTSEPENGEVAAKPAEAENSPVEPMAGAAPVDIFGGEDQGASEADSEPAPPAAIPTKRGPGRPSTRNK